MTARVRFEGVSKRYRLGLTRRSLPALLQSAVQQLRAGQNGERTDGHDFWALRDVSFELNAGESLALIGRNGAGKTTILKLLANITKPTSGNVATSGQLAALIELGAGFHPDLTGRENIYLNGAILGLSRRDIDLRYEEIVEFAELAQFIDTPVKRYSSGMTVRLGFAVASCLQPDILLVDEVLAVGDSSFQQKCMGRIRELLTQGTSIIFVSHNIYLVQAICDTALYLQNGIVQHRGATQDVIDRYEQDLHQERARKFADKTTHTDEQGEIEITRVEVTRPDGSVPGEHFASAEPVQVRVHYAAYRPIGTAHLSVFVTRADGLTCCMMRTKLDNAPLTVGRGRGVVTLTLDPLQLVSGSYFVEAWFLNDSDSMGITTRPGRSGWFSVKGRALISTETSGVFEPRTRWEHLTAETRAADDDVNGVVHAVPAVGR